MSMLLLPFVVGLAAAAPVVAGPGKVADLAIERWLAGGGQAAGLTAEGLDAAARAVPRGPTALRVQAQVGAPAAGQVLAAVDVPLAFGVPQARALRAEAGAVRAGSDGAALAYAESALGLWATWQASAHTVAHLGEWATEVEADLARVEAAGVGATLDLADLRAELAGLRAEALAAEATAEAARARLEARLASELALPTEHEDDAPVGTDNPWTALAARARAHPRVVRERAGAALAAARVGATREAPALELGAGRISPTAAGDLGQDLAVVGLSVPLWSGGHAARRAARGEAAAAAAQADWVAAEVAAGLSAEARAWEARRVRAEALHTEVVGPLAARVARLQAAVRDGHAPLERLIRARRDLHEAEHAAWSAQAELAISAARAELLADLMEGEG